MNAAPFMLAIAQPPPAAPPPPLASVGSQPDHAQFERAIADASEPARDARRPAPEHPAPRAETLADRSIGPDIEPKLDRPGDSHPADASKDRAKSGDRGQSEGEGRSEVSSGPQGAEAPDAGSVNGQAANPGSEPAVEGAGSPDPLGLNLDATLAVPQALTKTAAKPQSPVQTISMGEAAAGKSQAGSVTPIPHGLGEWHPAQTQTSGGDGGQTLNSQTSHPAPSGAASPSASTASVSAEGGPPTPVVSGPAVVTPPPALATASATTTAQATVAEEQPSPSDGDPLNSARLARGLRSAINQKGGAVTLRLTPPQMGTVRIQVQIQGATVSAQFHVQSDAASTMLNQQLTQLRTALEGQGLSVERLSVQTMPNPATSQMHQNQQQSDGSPQDGRSRGGFAGPGHQQQGNERGGRDDGSRQQQAVFEQLLLNEVA